MESEKKRIVSSNSLIEQSISEFSVLPKKVTTEIIKSFLGYLEREIASGSKVKLDGIGIFDVKDTPERKGRNPRTGEPIQIDASKKITFKAAKSLRESISDPARQTKQSIRNAG